MRRLPVFLTCPFLCGCLAFGYPSVSRTAIIQVEEPEVEAFRVVSGYTQSGPWMTGPIHLYQTVEKFPATNGKLPSQSDAYFAYYCLAIPVAELAHQQDLEIRLYRRGYETVSIPAAMWLPGPTPSTTPKWKRLEKLEEFENAIESIAGTHSGLGSVCKQDVQAFIAGEYAWL